MPTSFFRTLTPAKTEILIEPLSHVRSISVGFWVRRGSCHEASSEEGLAHFIEHTVFKGTEHYPNPQSMAEAMDRLGGHVDAFTGKESACFYGKVLRNQLPQLIDVLGDLVTRPRFDPEELVRERDVILEEISQSEDQPDDWASELFYEHFWKGCPVSHAILGRREQVKSYGPAETRRYFEKTYRAPNLLIAASGDLEPEGFMKLLQPVLERLPEGDGHAMPEPNTPSSFLLNVPRKDLQQASLVFGFPACPHQHPDRVAANLLGHILGGGMSSRLFMELRERNALCYQVNSYLAHYQDTGSLQVAASCAPQRVRELMQRAMAECARLASQGASMDELEQAKLHARTTLVFGQESTSARMFTLAHQALHMERILSLDEQIAEIDAVDLESLNRVGKKLLDPGKLGVTALGTRKSQEIRPNDLLV
jgi:predicted Zn-dependent peptidase